MSKFWYVLISFGIINRLRGSYGWFASVFGLCLVVCVYLLSGSLLIALLIGVGYWAGEMLCGWGDHVGNTSIYKWKVFNYFPDDGSDVGVRWMTSMLVYPKEYKKHFRNIPIGLYNWYVKIMNIQIKGYSLGKLLNKTATKRNIDTFVIDKALLYSRVFLVIRGLFWWSLPMLGIGLWIGNIQLAMFGLILISLAWPVCAELGYRTAAIWHTDMVEGGWEHQEIWTGASQVIIIAIISIIGY